MLIFVSILFVVGCLLACGMDSSDSDSFAEDDDTSSDDDSMDDDDTSSDDDTTLEDDDSTSDDDTTTDDDDSTDDDDTSPGDDDTTGDDDVTGDDDTTAGDDDTISDDDISDDDSAGDDDTTSDDDDTVSDDDISDDDTIGDDDTAAGDDDTSGDDDTTTGDDDITGDDDSTTDDDDDSTGDDDTTSDDDTSGDDDISDDDTTGDDDDDATGDPLEIVIINTGSSGIAPIQTILGNAGHNTVLLDYGTVALGIDPSYDLLIYPGGSDGVWAVINQPSLGTAIRDFVAAGHGFVGICGGAIVGSTDINYDGQFWPGVMAGLLDVEATWYSDWSYYVGNMTSLQFEVVMTHPVLAGYLVGDPFAGDYAGGPTLTSLTEDIYLNYDEDLDPALVGYMVSGSGALSIGEYYLGQVILSSIHPEYNNPDLLLAYVDWVSP